MLRWIIIVFAFVALLSPAQARPHHYRYHTSYHHYVHHYRHHYAQRYTPRRTLLMKANPTEMNGFEFLFGSPSQQPAFRTERVGRSRWAGTRPTRDLQAIAFGSASPSFDYSIGRPARFIAGRLACALNVGSALAERGIQGTGSAAALSYLHWGHSAGGPVPGAVIVSSRSGGGHVAIVSRVVNGTVMAWNTPGGSRGWQEIPYHRRVIDYRVPG